MTKKRKNSLAQRLNIISGQAKALAEIVGESDECEKITAQFYAINSGIKKVIELYFKENLEACLKATKASRQGRIDFLLKEIIKNK